MTAKTHPDTPPAPDSRSSRWPSTRSARLSHRRGAGGELRPPGHPDGAGPGDLHGCGSDFLRFDPELPDLGQPGPVRAVRRARVDAAVLDAAPDRGQVGQPRVRDRSVNPPSRWTTCAGSGSWTPSAPATPSTAGPPASSAPPARWAPASPPASAWPSPGSGRPPPSTGPATSCSTTTSTRCAATAA